MAYALNFVWSASLGHTNTNPATLLFFLRALRLYFGCGAITRDPWARSQISYLSTILKEFARQSRTGRKCQRCSSS